DCKTLPIPPQYCLCEITKEGVNITEEHSSIGHSIVTLINDRLKKANVTSICTELKLDKVTQLDRMVGVRGLYEVTVQQQPSGGVFQTSVRGSNGNYSIVVPDVIRLDKYGKQGDCTKNNEIRPMCYCKSNLLQTPSEGPTTKSSIFA
ncbi:hypothetical protein PMAYCL1PPCAC_13493, partial [Pristionchus mayeri]